MATTETTKPYISPERARLMIREPERVARFAERTGRTYTEAWAVVRDCAGDPVPVEQPAEAQTHETPIFARRFFVNEVGNKILIVVALGDRGCLCRFAMVGPSSEFESYTTRMELEQLRDALTEVLAHEPR